MSSSSIESVLTETRSFPPPDGVRARRARRAAWPTTRRCIARADEDPEGFWAEVAGELAWAKPWKRVLDWKLPDAKWFVGGKLNASVNCLDRHVDDVAQEQGGADLWRASPATRACSRTASCTARCARRRTRSTALGVKQGDFVAIYMPMIPEAAIAMLACARHRRAAHGRVRRVLGRGARATASTTAKAQARDHRRRRLAARRDRPAQGQRRRGARGHDASRRCSSSSAARTTVAMERGRDVWWHDVVDAASPTPRARERSTASTRCSRSTRAARPASRRASCTRPAAT